MNFKSFPLALTEARANFNKDFTFCRRASGHDGIYVPIAPCI